MVSIYLDNISSKYLSFHSVQQSGYGNFHQTGEVIYINNFSTSTPYYTPDVSWSTTLNSGVKYYSTDSNPTGTWTADYPTGGDTSEKELYLIGDFGTGNHWNDDPIYQEYKFTYDSETSTYVLNNVPFTRSGGSYFRIYNKTDKNQLGTLGTSNVTLSNGVSESLAVSADGAFQYESSTEKNVNIVISGNLNSITVSDNVVAQTYSVTNNASGVTVDKTTGITAGDTVTITPEDSNKKITAATITDASSNSISIVANDSDGTATFKMPASNVTISSVTLENKTTSTNIYYFWYWNGSKNNPVEMTPKEDGTYIFYTNSTYLYNGRKFKIANSSATGAQDNSDYCVNYNIGQSNISVSDSLSSNNVTVTHNGPTDNNDIQINGTSDYNFVIQYKPDTTDGIHGTIKVWSVDDYNNQTPSGLTAPKLKGDSSVTPGSKVTVSIDNQKAYYADSVAKTALDGLAFTFEVKDKNGNDVASTPSYSGKFLDADGNKVTTILDKITFTASNTEGDSYTVKATVSATDKAAVSSNVLNITVTANAIKTSDRIYAYALSLADGEKPTANNAWVAAEKSASAQNVYKDKSAASTYPSLGSTSESDLRIFLPSTASNSKVTLFNSFSNDIKVDGQTVRANSYATISYTPGQKMNVTDGATKTLTIYTSDAQSAVYLNNTGSTYSGYTPEGVPNMLKQIYDNKEKGISADNTGAISDSDGTKNVVVKKIKGRGNSTWDYTDKKSFNVSYGSTVTIGGVKASKFSFLANFKDPSLSRNKILYELADKMGVKYSPDTATVDLYMNGLYLGSYLACQKVDIGSDNLINNVTEANLDTTTTNFDFVMELDTKPDTANDFYVALGENRYLTMKTPEKPDSGTVPQAASDFVKGKYTQLLNALNGTSKTELEKIIDIDSLAKFYLLNELGKNYDIGVASTYFVYIAKDDKFYASPIWDLDMTASNGKSTDSEMDKNYRNYEGNWTNVNNTLNVLMRAAFNNVNVQSAARSIWTSSYYDQLMTNLNALRVKAQSVTSSYANNNMKWTQPYGFVGEFNDNLFETDNKSLNVAKYDANADEKYSKNSTATTYDSTASGQIDFVIDWLKSRAAWMTDKYNNYYITGLGDWNNTSRTMDNKNGINTYQVELSAGAYEFKISSDGGTEAYRSASAYSISYSPEMATNYTSLSSDITNLSVTTDNKNFSFKTSKTMTVYITYNQKNNTVTLSDQISSTIDPKVTLSGSTVKNEDIVAGTSVTLTATVTPATKDGVVLTGDYTVDLYRDGSKVSGQSKTVTFDAESSATQSVTFTTALVDTSQSYTVKVSYTDSEGTTLTADSAAVPYNQTGLKDQKIYFDPSTQYNGTTQIWKSVMTTSSTVTVTITDSSSTVIDTFVMSVDSEDIHGFDKGVFVADITAETLAKLQDSNNTITFALDGEDLTPAQTTGNTNIKSGWIYNYSNQKDNGGNETQKLWEEYNTPTTPSYPHSDITTYAQFKEYLAAMDGENNEYSKYKDKDKIVYFDNSVSKWYNVYIYGWDDTGYTSTLPEKTKGIKMQKLPYADIWYYVFDSSTDLTKQKFLFKDRGDAGFGSDYQQTVDLVGTLKADGTPVSKTSGFIMNGIREKVYLNFEGTILRNPCPIFVTQNFYLSTIQNDEDLSDGLKYRAFNTEWQNFYTVVSNTVQTSAVNVYFDLHEAANGVDDILLYHKSTATEQFKFPSEFTRLKKLPGSTIYHASLLLPHTDTELKFTFDKFVIGTTEYKMGTNAQPAFTCINTGEVWYEYAPSGISYKTTPAEATVLSAKPADDTSSVGANETNDSVAANTITVYFAPGNSSNTWENSNTDLTGRTFKCNVQGGDKDSNKWWSVDMVDTGKTIDSNKVYSATITYNDTGLFNMQFQKFNNSSFENQVVPIKKVWTNTDTMNGKFWNGSSWTDPNWGSATEIKDLYLIGGNFNDWKDNYNYKEYKLAYNETSDTYSITVDIAKLKDYFAIHDTSKQYSSTGSDDNSNTNRFITALNEEKSLTESTVAFKYTGDETGDVVFNVSGDLKKVWLSSVTTPTPTIKITAENETLTLSNGSASTQLTVTTENAGSATVSYTVSPSSGASVDENTKIFTATEAGTYEVTAKITVGDVDYSAKVTITVNSGSVSTTEYCGVLGYNHSTATFASTEGGKITNAYVNLTNGYYQTAVIPTGYTTVTDGVYTVIYALTSTGNSGATTENVGVTDADANYNNYTFNGWQKDSVPISTATEKTYKDSVTGTSTVAYLANWSKIADKVYTFTYKYYEYDKVKHGIEYAGTQGTVDEANGFLKGNYSTYTLLVSLPGNAEEADVKKAYIDRAPMLQSDYFVYSFDINDVTVTNNLEANAFATLDSVKKYKVTFTNDYTQNANVFYQNIVTLTASDEVIASLTSNKTLKWTDSYGNTLFIGNTYKFRVTKDVTVSYVIIDKPATINSTYVNEPTYEFYTTNTGVEKIRFNIRVDNIVDSNSNVTEYGIIRFYTDVNGKPLDSTIAQDENISSDTLKSLVAADGSASVTIYKINMEKVNEEKKYIYAPSMTNNTANKDKNVRVFSYFKIKNSDGTETIVVSDNSLILSINKAISA